MTSRLDGQTFLVTRTEEGNKIERQKLELLGAKVIELPLIETKEPKSFGRIDSAIERIGGFDWIAFTSASGVKAFFRRLSEKNEKKKSEIRARFACVGPETERALKGLGFRASLQPERFLTRELGREMVSNFEIRDKSVLLARAEEASRDLADILSGAGASVFEAPVYRTIARKVPGLETEEILGRITDITLTSPSTVRGLIMNFSPDEIKSRNIGVHCIGPVTAESARKAGLDVRSVASVHTIDGMIEGIHRRQSVRA